LKACPFWFAVEKAKLDAAADCGPDSNRRVYCWSRVLESFSSQNYLRKRAGLRIFDCQLPIFDWRLAIEPIGNRQSQIENPETHPLPRGGTDLMGLNLKRNNN
jgi:hypothetical protein